MKPTGATFRLLTIFCRIYMLRCVGLMLSEFSQRAYFGRPNSLYEIDMYVGCVSISRPKETKTVHIWGLHPDPSDLCGRTTLSVQPPSKKNEQT